MGGFYGEIGPFFYVRNSLIFNACTLEEGRHQADKVDNSYGHNQLWDANFRYGDYIDYPRGRVIWDTTSNKAIIYIDPCIKNEKVLTEITEKFELDDYVVSEDDHYHYRRCVGHLFG